MLTKTKHQIERLSTWLLGSPSSAQPIRLVDRPHAPQSALRPPTPPYSPAPMPKAAYLPNRDWAVRRILDPEYRQDFVPAIMMKWPSHCDATRNRDDDRTVEPFYDDLYWA